VFTARYGLITYITQIDFVFKGLILFFCNCYICLIGMCLCFVLWKREVLVFSSNEACRWWGKQNLLKFSGKQVWYKKCESFICIDVCYNWILLKLRAMGYSLRLRDSVCIHSFTLRTKMVKFVKDSLNFKSLLIPFRCHFDLFRTDLSKTSFLFVSLFILYKG
jgi:hypothetical protein